MKKKNGATTPSPLAKQSPSNAPSVSEGGSSGLAIGDSATQNPTPPISYAPSQQLDRNFQQVQPQSTLQPQAKPVDNIELPQKNTIVQGSNFDPFSKAPDSITQKTALGNKLSVNNVSPITTGSGGTSISSNEQLLNNQKIKDDLKLKNQVDDYDAYRQSSPKNIDPRVDAVDYYWNHLQRTDPEEYQREKDKEMSLINDKVANKGTGEDEKEDDLMIQKHQAQILQKALKLRIDVANGKGQINANALEAYKPILDEYESTSKEADKLNTQIKGIEDYITNNFQKNEQGQIISTPANRKVLEDLFSKRDEFISQLDPINKNLENLANNQDLKDASQLADESAKEYSDLAGVYTSLRNEDPNAYKSFPELKKNIQKKHAAQNKKDFDNEEVAGDIALSEAVTQAGARVVSSLAALPKDVVDLVGAGKGYGLTDKISDVVDSNLDDFVNIYAPLPTGYDKPTYNFDTGEWNLKYLPSKTASTIVEMAPMIAITLATEGATSSVLARMAAGKEAKMLSEVIELSEGAKLSSAAAGLTEKEAAELGANLFKTSKTEIAKEMASTLAKQAVTRKISTHLGAFIGEYTAVSHDFYKRATEMGLSDKEATEFSHQAATTQAVIGAFFPDVNMMRTGAGVTAGIKTYIDAIAKGKSKKIAMTDGTKAVVQNGTQQSIEEIFQGLTENADFNKVAEDTGLKDLIKKYSKNDITESTLISFAVAAGLGFGGFKSSSRVTKESFFMAASNPTIMMEQAKKMLNDKNLTQEQFDDFQQKLELASEVLSKMDPNLSAEKKINALMPMMEKADLKKKKEQLDDSQHDLVNEKIKNKDEEIKNALNSPSQEQLEHEEFMKSFVSEVENHADEKAKQEALKKENSQQKEGLVELDDSQKSQPIELNPIVENQKSETEQKIDALEEARTNLRQNEFLQHTIEFPEYSEKDDALEAEINKLKGKEDATEKSIPSQQDEITVPNLGDAITVEETVTPPVSEKVTDNSSVEQKSTETIKPDGFKNNIQDGGIVLGEAKANDHVTENGYTYRTVGDTEVSAINETGGVHPKEGKAKGGNKNIKYWSKGNGKFFYKNANSQNVIRVKNDNISSNEVVPSENLEIWDKAKNKFVPFSEHVNNKTETTENKKELQKASRPKEEVKDSGLIDEQESNEENIVDDPTVLQRAEDDLNILKKQPKLTDGLSKIAAEEVEKNASLKFMGILERAYKAKIDKKIKPSTYEEIKQRVTDAAGPRIATNKIEIDAKFNVYRDKVKQKLLGDGYKNAAFSAPFVTPKTVENLIDVTAELMKSIAHVSISMRQAADFALDKIKKYPAYKSILEQEGVSDKDFRKAFESKVPIIETKNELPKQEVASTPIEKKKIDGIVQKGTDVYFKQGNDWYKKNPLAEHGNKVDKIDLIEDLEKEHSKNNSEIDANLKSSKLYKNDEYLKNEDGTPVLLFHGSSTDFKKTGFNKDFFYKGEGGMSYGSGFYFTDSPLEARAYQFKASLNASISGVRKKLSNEKDDAVKKEFMDLLDNLLAVSKEADAVKSAKGLQAIINKILELIGKSKLKTLNKKVSDIHAEMDKLRDAVLTNEKTLQETFNNEQNDQYDDLTKNKTYQILIKDGEYLDLEQPVDKSLIEKIKKDYPNLNYAEIKNGFDLYVELTKELTGKDYHTEEGGLYKVDTTPVSDYLTKKGVIGNKHAGVGGTHYIVFQPADIEIINDPYKKPTEEKTTETKASDEPKTNGTTDTNEQTSENNSNELPKSEPPAKKFSDTNSGEKGERMLAQRLRTNEKLDKVNEKIGKDALLYDKQKSLDLLAEYVDDIVKDYEKNGLLVDLAKEMAEGKSPFDDAIATYAATSVYDKLNNLAEKELDIQVKDELESLAAKALASARDIVTKSAKILGNNRLISKYLPISKAGIKAVVQAQIDLIQDQNISKKEKAELLNVTEQLSSIMETEEFKKLLEEKLTEKINQIAEDGAGKEVMAKFDASLDDLITPLEEC